MSTDLRSVSLFRPMNDTGLHFSHKISNLFYTATNLHYSFFILSILCLLFIIMLICCLCFVRFPKTLLNCLCCCAPTNCVKVRVQARVLDVDQLQNYRNLIRNEQAQQFLPNAPARPNVRNILLQVLPSIHEEREQNPPIHVQPPYNPACPQNIPTCPCGTQAVRCQAIHES